ncbi:glutaredoxin 3, partial [Bifidobacterium thermophilum]|nr:glutaredoxin 3 [Bifidobacterium thermophilum]
VLMYTSGYCPYCVQAERLLMSKGVTDIEKVRVDTDPARRTEMMEKTGRRTVPQIYIDDFHVGGCDDLHALDREGKLDPLLQA